MKKMLLTLLFFFCSLSFADSNVHLDPKITNVLNPSGDSTLWTNYSGSQNQYLYPSNAVVKINSTAFDNYARFSFYRKDSVGSIEPKLFNDFADSGRIPYTFVWDSQPGDNKRQTLYARGNLQFQQNGEKYQCNDLSFFTTSSRVYVAINNRYETPYNSWMSTPYGNREAVKLVSGKSLKAICDSGNNKVLFDINIGSPVDGYIYPMTFTKVHTYNMQEPNAENLNYVIFWSWNHMNNEYGEKRFMDNGRFNTPDVKGIRINSADVTMDNSSGEVENAVATPQKNTDEDKVISISSVYENIESQVQDYNSPSLSYAMAKSYAIAHASAFKSAYSTKAKVKMPLFGDVEHTITLDYTGTTTKTETTTDTVTVNIQSQKIAVKPGCTVQVMQILNTSKEVGIINIASKLANNVVSDGVAWKTDGSQVKVKGTYSLYDLLSANNPTPSESWIQLDNKNKTVLIKDLATYTATRDNSVITKINLTCKGKTTTEENQTTPNF